MITALYASVLALLICWLTLQVIKARKKNQVRYADGGVEELQIARTAHSNAVEYIPITLILLFLLETNGASIWLLHLGGMALLIGRLLHCRGILGEWMTGRVLGMQITIFTLVSLALSNLFYLSFDKLFS
ncbi:MAG: MAPEG family protein [Motiliproteus sp.]